MIGGLIVTKNESGLLRLNLDHHLAWGFDFVAVADNDSTDATPEVAASYGSRVITRRFSDFHLRQTARLELLRDLVEASNGAIEWAAVYDTDEFFWAPDVDLADLLGRVPDDIVAVNFDAKLFLPTALDEPGHDVIGTRAYRSGGADSPLHSSYDAGKTFYRVSWLLTLPLDHWCPRHEHLCNDVPHARFRPPEALVHHYMVQDEDQFVDKVVRLVEWARPPDGVLARALFRMTPKQRRSLPKWSAQWKKDWWAAYQRGGVEGVRDYYREVYVIPEASVHEFVAAGTLAHDDAFARHHRARIANG